MADDVQVTIGATLDDLLSSVEGAKSSLAGLGEVFGAAFSVDAIKNFVESMADLGTQTERTAAILGITEKSAQELGFISQVTGGNAQTLALSMERLQVGLQRAQIATSPQAAALRALGLSAQELVKVPIDQQMNLFADAVSKFADGGTKTAAVLMLAGRGAAQLIPFLDQGSAGLDRLRQSADQAGAIVSNTTIRQLENLHQSLETTKASLTALGETLVAQFAVALSTAASKMSAIIGNFTTLIATGHLWESELEGIQYAVLSLAADVMRAGFIVKDFFTLNWGQIQADWAAGTTAQEALLEQHLHNMGVILLKGKMQLQHDMATPPSGLPQTPPSDLGGAAAAKAADQAAQDQIKSAELAYRGQAQLANFAAKIFQTTEQQKTTALIAAVNQREDVELKAIDDAQKGMSRSAPEFAKLEGQKTQIVQRAVNDRQRAIEQGQEKEVQSWLKTADTVTNAFTSQLNALLSGTETFGQAMQKVFAKMIEDMIAALIKLLGEELVLTALGIGPVPIQALLPEMPSFDVGTTFVPQTGVGLIHKGEAIIPEALNPFGGGGGGGVSTTNNSFGGASVNLNVSAIDAQSFASSLMRNRNALNQVINYLSQGHGLGALAR